MNKIKMLMPLCLLLLAVGCESVNETLEQSLCLADPGHPSCPPPPEASMPPVEEGREPAGLTLSEPESTKN